VRPAAAAAAPAKRRLVMMSHMARAISASFSSPVVDNMRGLPQHQQMVLCAAVRQGLTLVHFSAQLEPCLTQENTIHTLNTP